MEASTLGGDEWQRQLEIARSLAKEYENADLTNPDARFFRKEYLFLASIRYYLAHGLCMDEKQRARIAEEKAGIEAKLKALDNGTDNGTHIGIKFKTPIKQRYSLYK